MNPFISIGLVISFFLRMFCSIKGNFAFDALTIVLIIGMIYDLDKSGKLSDIMYTGLATITIIIVYLLYNL